MHPTADFASRTFQKPPLIRKCSKNRHSFEASPLSSGDYRRKARPSQAITFQKPPLISGYQLNRRSFEQRSHFRRLSPSFFKTHRSTYPKAKHVKWAFYYPLKILEFCPLPKAATRQISKQGTHIELFCMSSISKNGNSCSKRSQISLAKQHLPSETRKKPVTCPVAL